MSSALTPLIGSCQEAERLPSHAPASCLAFQQQPTVAYKADAKDAPNTLFV